MSNTLAVATVTATLQNILQQALNGAAVGKVDGAEVKALRPGAQGSAGLTKGVGLYLFQTITNAAGRNLDLPTRDTEGRLVRRPQVALDLHYLLSFYGDDTTLEPQRMLGIVAAALHARPVLTPQAIRDTLADSVFAFLAGSDLAEQIELVRFTPVAFSLEELSKVWSILFQTPHALSLAYQASVVYVESDDVPRAVVRVRDRRFFTGTVRQPVITALRPPVVARPALLSITGRALRADVTRVNFRGAPPVAPSALGDELIEVPVPAVLAAGVNVVSVVHDEIMTTARGETRTVPIESNLAAFLLIPRITSPPPLAVAAGGALEITVDPMVAAGQRVALLVGDFMLEADPPAAATDTLSFPIPADLPPGVYALRVDVDGAISSVEEDAAPPGFRPALEVTGP